MRRAAGFLGMVTFIIGVLVALPATAHAAGAPPVAQPDSYVIKSGKSLRLIGMGHGVLANDSDPEGDRLTAVLVSPPPFGTFALRRNGTFDFTPNFTVGTVTFSYSASDGTTTSPPVQVTLKVDLAPTVQPDFWGVLVPGTLTVDAPGVLLNDTDFGGDILSAQLVEPPSHGTLQLNPDGSFVYAPDAGFLGRDHFRYRATDGRRGATTTVTIKVALTNTPPVANPDEYRTPESSPIDVAAPGVLANDTDADGDPLQVILVLEPAPTDGYEIRPDGSFSISPMGSNDGDLAFTYRVTDGIAFSPPVRVDIDVIAINNPPTGQEDAYTFTQDAVAEVPAPGVLENDFDDVEFDGVRVFDLVTGPAHGELDLRSDGSFTYTPDPGFVGVDGFVYRPGDADPGNPTHVQIEVLPIE